MKTMEFFGRNVDEAIFHGLVEMGLTIDQVKIEIVQRESKGLFGLGAKNAVVRLSELETPVTPVFETVPHQEKPSAPARSSESKRSDSQRRTGKSSDQRRNPSEKDSFKYDEELAKTNPAAVFLADLLKAMNIDATVQAAMTDDGLRLNILSDTDGLLIGHRGETLDSIQYLVSLYLNKDRKENAYVRVTVDTEGYRARREETLRKLARRTAAKVAKTGRAVTMEPMNPYERRILHSSLQNFHGVTTFSEGEEPNRAVTIAPDK